MHIELSNPESETVEAPCSNCKGKRWHKVVSKLVKTCEEERGFYYMTEYCIIQCKGCDSVSFKTGDWDSSTEGSLEPDEYIEDCKAKLFYPPFPENSGVSMLELGDRWFLPDKVRGVYVETINAAMDNHVILASLGLRTILESICHDKGVSPRVKLVKKINILIKDGVLTQQESEILHDIRLLGNDAAHEAHAPSLKKLVLAVEVVETMLKKIYIFPKKHAAILKRNEKKDDSEE